MHHCASTATQTPRVPRQTDALNVTDELRAGLLDYRRETTASIQRHITHGIDIDHRVCYHGKLSANAWPRSHWERQVAVLMSAHKHTRHHHTQYINSRHTANYMFTAVKVGGNAVPRPSIKAKFHFASWLATSWQLVANLGWLYSSYLQPGWRTSCTTSELVLQLVCCETVKICDPNPKTLTRALYKALKDQYMKVY